METLTVMNARIVKEACIAVPLAGNNLGRSAITSDPELSGAVASALRVFANAICRLLA
jgi:hypothetical protein